jgi:hypothetical protein
MFSLCLILSNTVFIIMSRVLVTYRRGFLIRRLDLLYLTPSHTGTANNTELSLFCTLSISPLHALGFSVFTSRILATDLSQSRSQFKLHMESYFHNLIPF